MNSAETRFVRPVSDDAMWHAVVHRIADFDGTFFYSVATTGVYCRPSCPSRQALRRHVSFHASCAAAEAAGFRPCKRCRPDQVQPHRGQIEIVARACKMIEAAEDPVALDELAASVNLSPYHFHRLFKKRVGVTPKAYAETVRHGRVREHLSASSSVTEAIHQSGYSSSGRFYASSNEILGMSPQAYRRGGKGAEIWFAVADCSLGAVLVAQSAIGICAISMGDDPQKLVDDLQDLFPHAALRGGDAMFERRVSAVISLIEQPGKSHDLPLDIRGTAFQHQVWLALRNIPPGTTASYAEIAQAIGKPKAVRAVARACAANKLAIVVPCHRVVRSDGSLSGYRWGIARKSELLARESKS